MASAAGAILNCVMDPLVPGDRQNRSSAYRNLGAQLFRFELLRLLSITTALFPSFLAGSFWQDGETR